MVHNEVFKLFKTTIGVGDALVDVWFPNGKNSVRIRYVDRTELVFTYTDVKHWKLETVGEFLRSRKGW